MPWGAAVLTSDEREAIERARTGDPDSFGALYSGCQADVARVCARLLAGAGDLDPADAHGEVYLRARRAAHSLDPERPFRPWVLAVASHHCIDLLRRRARERKLFDPDGLDEAQPAAPGPSPLSILDWGERREEVVEAIDALPAHQRVPLLLRYYGDLDYRAIAEVLQVSRGQVGSLLTRARRALRERLAAEDGT